MTFPLKKIRCCVWKMTDRAWFGVPYTGVRGYGRAAEKLHDTQGPAFKQVGAGGRRKRDLLQEGACFTLGVYAEISRKLLTQVFVVRICLRIVEGSKETTIDWSASEII